MTATDAAPLACPYCASTNTTIGGSGSAMCLDCATMWDPADADPVNAPREVSIIDGQLVAGVEALTTELRGLAEELEGDMVGGVATLEGGQTGEVVAFAPDGDVIVKVASGDLLHVAIGDVERIMPPVVIPEPVAMPDTIAAAPPDMVLALTLAQTIIRAGCESVNGSGENVTPGVPPVGYLPTEPELHAVVERAAGLAVGMLIEVFELDVEAILEWVGAVSESDDEATA